MYPYFQKNIPLQAAENSSSDPIQAFLSQNPAFGTLIFQVTGGQGAFPVPDAVVTLSKMLHDNLSLSVTIRTDESGKTEPISLPAPDRKLSQSPNNGIVYAAYDAKVTTEGFLPTEIRNLPVRSSISYSWSAPHTLYGGGFPSSGGGCAQ